MNSLPAGHRLTQFHEGLLRPPNNLELPVTDHCNLTCQDCNHSSPVQAPWSADPDQVYLDLSRMARVYRPRRIKVLGGEPLLHKRLGEVMQAVHASGIADSAFLTSNGMLLDRMSDELWQAFDEVEVSRYPGCLDEAVLERARARAREHGVTLSVNEYSHFRSTLSERENTCPQLVADIYATCKVAHYWGCHMVRQGFFYKCPRSVYLPILLHSDGESEGLAIDDSDDFQARLLNFVNDPAPLRSCRHCLGTVGRKLPHRLVPRSEWRRSLDAEVTDLLDLDLLRQTLEEGF